jgi:putative nucleotidyltransferase with HDIG domain
MLKKIPVSQLRLGMHVHALDGSWLDHPFWKSRFMLRDADDLRELRASGISECWIDSSKGCDVGPSAGLPRQHAPSTTAGFVTKGVGISTAPAPPPARRSLNEELHQAAAVCSRGREAMLTMFQEARMGRAIEADACQPLVEEITQSVMRNPGALVSLARLKTKDDYSYMHSMAVCALMISLGRQLGMDVDECRVAGMAGLLHDIGKALMPLDVLNKPGKLTDDEYMLMKTHPLRGHELLSEQSNVTEVALDVCLHHHERIDGAGYPFGLDADRLSRLARMGAVCDVYDAITSNRPYKDGWDPAESIARMASWKGHFDGDIFGAFVRSLGIYPTGSMVRMESERLAVVLEQHPDSLVTPVVKAFFSIRSNMPITPMVIDLSRPQCNDRIVGRESAAKWGFSWINDLWLPPEVQQRSR